jgi:hypothetical protein
MEIKMNNAALNELELIAEQYITNVAEDIKAKAQQEAPYRTGKLRNSIEVTEGMSAKEKFIGSDLYYAVLVEMGHLSKKGNWVQAQPYLRPALDAIIGRW